MSDQLTDAELAEIEERVNAATAGPWKNRPLESEGDSSTVYQMSRFVDGREVSRICEVFSEEANAAFVAHARQDVPRLLAEVKRLRAHVERVTASHRTEGE
jgi:hypothetical protein